MASRVSKRRANPLNFFAAPCRSRFRDELGLAAVILLMASGVVRGQTQELVFPVVVSGVVSRQPAHYQTTFTLLNLSDQVLQATLRVYDDTGVPGPVFCGPVSPLSSVSPAMNAGGAFHESSSADPRLSTFLVSGWARLSWDGAALVQASAEVGLIRGEPEPCVKKCNRPSTDFVTTAQIWAVKPAREFRSAATIGPMRESAYSLVNPAQAGTAAVVIEALNPSGGSFDRNEFKIAPQQRVSGFLFELLILNKVFVAPPQRPEHFHGSVRILADRPIAVGAFNVQFPEGKLTNLPLIAADR